jgi:rubredoxin
MAEWVCASCGYVRDSRCKPRKCPECGSDGGFEKAGEVKPASGKVPGSATAPQKPAKTQAGKSAKKPAPGSATRKAAKK